MTAPADRVALRRAVLDWFERNGRDLAFRPPGGADPWGVLVSEVMAQQTQAARVAERWPAFMAAYPTPAAMAAASPADVIRAWRGLGYNRRARDLHRAATAITAGGGTIPGDPAALGALPGIGPYTARAVAAIAFGRPVGAVDVNVRRVVGRIVAEEPGGLTAATLQVAADDLVDPERPGAWTHALMDLGATICRPLRPACGSCPARPWCAAGSAVDEAAESAAASGARPTGGHAATRRGSKPARGRAAPRRAVPFERTTRWLRGRIVDRLRDASPGVAVVFSGPLGTHDAPAVTAAVEALVHDGLVELDGAGGAHLAGGPQSACGPSPGGGMRATAEAAARVDPAIRHPAR